MEPGGNSTPGGNSQTRVFDPSKLPLGHSQTKVMANDRTLGVNPGRHCGVQPSPDTLPAQLSYDAPITAFTTLPTSHELGSHTRLFAPSKRPLASQRGFIVDAGVVALYPLEHVGSQVWNDSEQSE